MSVLFNIISTLAPILILAGIIATVVGASRQRRGGEPGIGTVRRLLGYGASLAGLALLTAGATLLVGIIIESATGESVDQSVVALGLAFVFVGTPVWIASWLVMNRVIRSHPGEVGTLARKAYLHIVLSGSVLAAMLGAAMFFSNVGRDGEIDAPSLAIGLIPFAIWLFHWRLQESEGQLNQVTTTIRRIYIYGISLVGVILLVIGVGSLLTILLSGAYDSLFRSSTVISGSRGLWREATQVALAQMAVGSVAVWWHWTRAAGNDAGSWIRSVYLYPVAILGGAVALVAASSVGLYHVLQWLFGNPDTSSRVDHFDVFPGLVATAVVGAAVWIYHWQIAREEAAADEQSAITASRIYHYLVSALGLGTLAVGIVMLFELLVGLLSPSGQPNLRGDLWRNPLAMTVTLLAVGTPVWLVFWRRVQLAAERLGGDERDSLTRRVYIYGTFGVALVASLITLSIVLFFVFEAILGDREAGRLPWDSRWSIAILLTAGISTAYFWQVLREDRAVLAETAAERHVAEHKRVTLLVPVDSRELVDALESALGYGVTAWRTAAGVEGAGRIAAADIDRAAEEIASSDLEHVLVVAEDGRLRVMPYEE